MDVVCSKCLNNNLITKFISSNLKQHRELINHYFKIHKTAYYENEVYFQEITLTSISPTVSTVNARSVEIYKYRIPDKFLLNFSRQNAIFFLFG